MTRLVVRSQPLSSTENTRPPEPLDARAPKVLLVTACPWTGRTIELALGAAGLATVRVADPHAAESLAAAGSVDALVVDERLTRAGHGSPETVCRALAEASSAPCLPIVLLTHDPIPPAAVDALHLAGVWGVAWFPHGAQSWVTQLALWTRSARAARRQAEAGLVDASTGLYNARGLLQRAAEVDGAARRAGGALACAVFAVEPPRAAQAVADACRRMGRTSDVFGRIGEQDFAVIAPGADASGVRSLVDRIAEALADATPGRPPAMRVGVCAVSDGRLAALSVGDMLAHAASRA